MPFPTVVRADLAPSRWLTAAAVLVLSAAASGCARKVVAAAPAPVPLAVPVVPPRIVGPVVVPDERPQPVAEAPAAPAPRPAPRPKPGGLAVRPPDAPPEAPVEDPQRARAEGAEGTTPAAAPLLRTRETANDAEAVKKVKDVLTRAEQNLAKVNYRALSANGRQQHDTARRFITQAGDALEKRQLTFALSLADKAEALSTSLVNR